jgi:hypothetical protein
VSHPKISDAKRITWRKFYTEGPQVFGATVQNLVAPGFAYPYHTDIFCVWEGVVIVWEKLQIISVSVAGRRAWYRTRDLRSAKLWTATLTFSSNDPNMFCRGVMLPRVSQVTEKCPWRYCRVRFNTIERCTVIGWEYNNVLSSVLCIMNQQMHNWSTIYYTVLYYTAPTNTASKNLCNLASTDYEHPEDDAIVSKHVGAV